MKAKQLVAKKGGKFDVNNKKLTYAYSNDGNGIATDSIDDYFPMKCIQE